MISPNDEYKKMINKQLRENIKSFRLLYDMKHYGNCITIMCQELDQLIRLLFLLNSNSEERENFIHSSINSQKWYIITRDNKKQYITDEILLKFTESLVGWDKSIYEFGFSFKNLTNNFNYGSKDPIKSMNEYDRSKLSSYIIEYHDKEFPLVFTLQDIIPILPMIIEEISKKLKIYLEKI